MANPAPPRVFEDYDPPSDLVSEEACDTLLIYLPGFKKEQLRVQLTTSRMLKVSGERPIGGNKYRRFLKEFRVPSNCDTKEISAKFEGGILYIRQPKIITPAARTSEDQGKAAADSPMPQQQAPPQPTLPQQAATPLPQPQPQPTAPPSVQLQPQREPPLSAQPQPQLEVPPLPQPQIPDKEASTNALEGKAKAEEKVEDEFARMKREKDEMASKFEETEDKSGLLQQSKQLVGGVSLKRFGISVLLVLIIGFYISYMFKSFMGDKQRSVLEYDQEL